MGSTSERAKEELGRVRGALAGRVAIGLPTSVAKVLTVPLTREFRQRLPDASLSISEGLSSSMLDGLLTGRLDLAVLYNAAPSPELELTPLVEEDLYLVQAAGTPVAAEGITLRELVRGTAWGRLRKRKIKHAKPVAAVVAA